MRNYSEYLSRTAWYAFVLIFIVYSIVVGFWLLYPYDPITVNSITIENPGKQVRAGELLVYKIHYKKHMNASGTLTRKLVNSYKIDMADSHVTAPAGRDCDQVKLKVPEYADPGIYYLWWSVTYEVNPVRKITVSKESEKFEVVK